MDIQFAYNLERLLYYTTDNTHTVDKIMRAVDDQFNFKPNATGKQTSFLLVMSCLVFSCLVLSYLVLSWTVSLFSFLLSFNFFSFPFYTVLLFSSYYMAFDFFSIIFNNHCITEDMQERVLCMNMILYIYKKLLH